MTRTATVLHEYALHATRRAVIRQEEDGVWLGYVAELPGLIVYSASAGECLNDFYSTVSQAVWEWSTAGETVPVIDGIDLNTDEARRLVAYEKPVAIHKRGCLFSSEHDLDLALDEPSRRAC